MTTKITDLPSDLLVSIFTSLTPAEALNAGLTSKSFQEAFNDDSLWERYAKIDGAEELGEFTSWKELYKERTNLHFDKWSTNFTVSNDGKTVFKKDGDSSFWGAQLDRIVPKKGLFYFEVKVEHHEYRSEWDDEIKVSPNNPGARWFSIGVASHRWDCDGCGWWDTNDGSGWYATSFFVLCASQLFRRYAAGDSYNFGEKHPDSTDTINSGDSVGCLIDATNGIQCVPVPAFLLICCCADHTTC